MLRFLALALLAYFAVAVLACALQSKLLYLRSVPGRDLSATPADAGLAFEETYIDTEDGLALHAWYVPADPARATLLFFHGNAGNVSHRIDSIRIFHDLGLSVLIIDYRGYGLSEGRPSETGTRRDARAAWDHLVSERGVPPGRIVVFGRSLGAAVAAELARGRDPGAVILESAFTSVPDIAQEAYWFLPARWLSRFDYATADYVRDVTAPVLVIHSEDDDIIPLHHGLAVHDAAREPKRLLVLRGDHNTGYLVSASRYRKGIDEFLADVAELP